jgi:tetratricopeptide (TPR) repeat protein
MNTKDRRLSQLGPVLAAAVLSALLLPVPALAIPATQSQRQQGPAGPMTQLPSGVITLIITDEDGRQLDTVPTVTIASTSTREPILQLPNQIGDHWEFRYVPVGDTYVVTVNAGGYESQQQYLNLADVGGAAARAIFRLHKSRTVETNQGEAGDFILAPRAQKEVQQGLKDLRSGKTRSALKHLSRAVEMAPGNPAVNYLLGIGYWQDHQAAQAILYLEKAVSIDSGDVEALLALGTIHYQQGDDARAIDQLTSVVTAAPDRWQAQWMLATAYLREHKYAEARDHAEATLKSGKDKAQRAHLVLGQALAGLGKRSEAATIFETYLRQNPSDPDAGRVQEWVKQLRQPLPVEQPAAAPVPRPAAAAPMPATPPLPATPPVAAADDVPVGNWLPADVDAVHPAIISGVACPLSRVMKKARMGTAAFMTDLGRFSATEEFQSVSLNRHGKVDYSYDRKFHYLLFVTKTGKHEVSIEEMRDRQTAPPSMGGPVVETGSAALALVFHPDYERAFEWNCEGLGRWRGTPAWLVHFRQRPDRPVSPLADFVAARQSYPLALKGRAWLEQQSGRVLHLDADLVKPVKQVRLDREHFSIDYREVAFASHPVKLWLPEDVNTYIEYQGHVYHQYHHFENFQLFWVGTGQRISQPKLPEEKKR